MEVNKAASWEDVLSNNFNSEPQQEQQQTQETQPVETETATEKTKSVETESNESSFEDAALGGQEQFEAQVEENYVGQGAEELLAEIEEDTYDYEGPSIEDLTEDELYDILSVKKTDFNELSDLDIVSGFLYDENPRWDDEDVAFELEQKYGSALFEEKIDLNSIDKDIYPDEYKEAVKHNKEIDRAQKLLRRDALEKRSELEAMQANIQLPTAKRSQPVDDNVNHSVEVDNSATDQLTPEQIQALQQQWIDSVEREVPNVDEFKFQFGDEEVSYRVTDEEKQQLVEQMKNFNAENYLIERGWVNADGTPNVKKITEDVYILENSQKMFKSGWTQVKEKAKMDIIGKDIKNIDFTSKGETFDAKASDPHAFGNFVLGL